ncbi:MAG: hypothetical protein AB7U46_04110 [Paenirhodobacter sp.]|uniref:hypothetical protein n=1 Tax=Paenirhodobacter sp. TaxID=1965326 RepID=UPI003D0B697C
MTDTTDQLIEELVELLRIERDTIRNGEFDALAHLADRKLTVMDALSGTPARKLLEVQAMAHDNRKLLEAALVGVRSAQSRLKAIRAAMHSYQSYDKSGKPRTISPGGGTLERRA